MDPIPHTSNQPEIVLDLSRLLSRVLHPTPTGVDRVEMAYARGLLATVPDRLHFAAVHPTGVYGRLPHGVVKAFLDETEERWQQTGRDSLKSLRPFAARTLWALRPRPVPAKRLGRTRLYVQSSPNNLINRGLVSAILQREGARMICMVHDLIPIQYPEYAKPKGAALHQRRIDTITALADGIITNSHATMDDLRPHLDRSGRSPELAVAHLGISTAMEGSIPPAPRPYFVCVGTIEPRKNHLLLLHLWRSLSGRYGCDAVPHLMIVGRRGWENEQVVDMLERCPALRGCVQECNGLPDREIRTMIAGARGLVLPSFAEGYGMPVTEALALGVPVVCSDLPALREAGGGIPTFLDPLDGPAWERAIIDLAGDHSAIRAEQMQRLRTWQPPIWKQHIAILLELLRKVAQ